MNITGYLGQKVNVVIDRPLGSKHPKHGYTYEVNYGYIPNTKAPDGEDIDAYVLGIDKSVDKVSGICVAVIHRTDDEDDKLVVTPSGKDFSNEEIEKLVEFQEKWFKHIVLRTKI